MARTLPRNPGPTVPTPPTVPPPGGGFPPKPGLDGKGDQQDPKKGGRTHRRNLASPCDRPPATPQNVQMNFHVTEAKTHLNYHARITWDDVDTDTSGFHINTVDRWEVQWRALDSDGDPVQEEHAGLTAATNPNGDTYRFNLSHGVTWDVGDRVKVTGCFPQTDYNGKWTIINKLDPDTIEVKGQQTSLQNADRTGEIFNLSTDQHYNRKLRNPVAKIALKSAKMIVTTPGNKNITSIKNVGGQIWRVQTGATHGFTKQDFVKITGASPGAYNGTWNVRNIIDADEFEVTGDTAGLANSTSGTVSGAVTQFEYKTRGDNGFNVGQRIKVENCRPEVDYNGNWTVTATPGTDTFRVSSNRAPNNPLNDAEVPGRVLDQEDNLHVLTNHIPRPKSWSWEARVRCRSGEGCWSDFSPWTAPQLPYQDADPQPPIPQWSGYPFGSPITFDHKGKRKHDKIRAVFTFNEVLDWDVPGGDRESDMRGYDVRLDSSTDRGVTWEGTTFVHHIPAKKDSDAGTTVDAVFHRIARHYRYRASVRSVDRFGRRSDWSAWTPSALPFDDNGPPPPKNVTRFALHDRVRIEWDEPTVNYETRGTVSGLSGTNIVTGVGTKFIREVGSGTTISINGVQYLVNRVISDTSLRIVGTLLNSSSAQPLFLIEEDPDVAGYEAQMADAVDVTVGSIPDDWNNVFRTHRGTANGHTFRVPTGLEEHQWYLRVRAFDAARNKSDWIPAIQGLNSNPNTDGEFIQLIRDVTQVTFVQTYVENPPAGQAHTDLQTGQLEGMWLADRDYRFLNIRSSIGNHDPSTHPNDGTPTGQPIHMNVRRIRDYGLSSEADDYVIDQGGTAPEKLAIQAGDHGDSVNPGTAQFAVPNVYAGEYLYGNVTQTGGPARPGKHLRITCTLVPLQI